MKLYYAPGSSSMASHLALEEAGAHFETHLVNEEAGEHKTAAYLRVNPRGKVPALRRQINGALGHRPSNLDLDGSATLAGGRLHQL